MYYCNIQYTYYFVAMRLSLNRLAYAINYHDIMLLSTIDISIIYVVVAIAVDDSDLKTRR